MAEISNQKNVAWDLDSRERKGWSKLVGKDIITLRTKGHTPGAYEFIITKGDKETSYYCPPSSDVKLLDEYIHILTEVKNYRINNGVECDKAYENDAQVIKWKKKQSRKSK